MGQHEIIAKIADELARPLEHECQVLYIMVEIRKYHDVTRKQSPLALRLFCNWVAHTSLDRGGVEEVLARVDKYVEVGKNKANSVTFDELQEALATLSFNELRTALATFLKQERLDTSVCDDHSTWKKFLALYLGIVRECPLQLQAKPSKARKGAKPPKLKMPKPKHIDSITLKESGTFAVMARDAAGKLEDTVKIEWHFYKNGKPLSIHVMSS